jgi:hypothetical protein
VRRSGPPWRVLLVDQGPYRFSGGVEPRLGTPTRGPLVDATWRLNPWHLVRTTRPDTRRPYIRFQQPFAQRDSRATLPSLPQRRYRAPWACLRGPHGDSERLSMPGLLRGLRAAHRKAAGGPPPIVTAASRRLHPPASQLHLDLRRHLPGPRRLIRSPARSMFSATRNARDPSAL